jgi:hypothetical protein
MGSTADVDDTEDLGSTVLVSVFSEDDLATLASFYWHPGILVSRAGVMNFSFPRRCLPGMVLSFVVTFESENERLLAGQRLEYRTGLTLSTSNSLKFRKE